MSFFPEVTLCCKQDFKIQELTNWSNQWWSQLCSHWQNRQRENRLTVHHFRRQHSKSERTFEAWSVGCQGRSWTTVHWLRNCFDCNLVTISWSYIKCFVVGFCIQQDLGPYVWGANNPVSHVYFLNGDDTEKIGMCGAEMGLSGWPKRVYSYTCRLFSFFSFFYV